jgi:hypothetical protein
MQQLHGFAELRYDQWIIRNCSAKIDIKVVSPFSESCFSFRHFPIAKIIENGRSDGGENRLGDPSYALEGSYGHQLHLETILM